MDGQQTLLILGLGSVGAAIAGRVRQALPAASPVRVAAADTDRRRLEQSGLPEEDRLLVAVDWHGGRGCGGDVLKGQAALAHDRNKLEALIGKPEFLLVTAAFGGGTATGGAGIVLSICRKNDIPVFFLGTLPFSQEGHSRREAAENAIRQDLLPGADAVLALPNDLLYSILPPTTPVLQAYEAANREFAETALGVALLLTQNNLLAPEAESLAAIMRRRKSFCSIGVGRGQTGPDRCLKALETMLQSPLLGGAEKVRTADAVLLSLIGGGDLSLGEVRQTLDAAVEFTAPTAKVLSGASVEPTFGDRVMMCCITVKFDETPETAARLERAPVKPSAKPRAQRARSGKHVKDDSGQQEFHFESMSKGMMEKTQPVIWNGEDLDEPTWRRQSVPFEKGELVTADTQAQ